MACKDLAGGSHGLSEGTILALTWGLSRTMQTPKHSSRFQWVLHKYKSKVILPHQLHQQCKAKGIYQDKLLLQYNTSNVNSV